MKNFLAVKIINEYFQVFAMSSRLLEFFGSENNQ